MLTWSRYYWSQTSPPCVCQSRHSWWRWLCCLASYLNFKKIEFLSRYNDCFYISKYFHNLLLHSLKNSCSKIYFFGSFHCQTLLAAFFASYLKFLNCCLTHFVLSLEFETGPMDLQQLVFSLTCCLKSLTLGILCCFSYWQNLKY